MHAYVQWALAHPSDWERIERGPDWKRLPGKPKPDGTEAIDDAPGHVMSVIVGGDEFQGYDGYSLNDIARGGVRVTVWNDDPEDWAVPYGLTWDIYPPKQNTEQYVTCYTDDPAANFSQPQDHYSTEAGPWTWRPWADFPRPSENQTRYGVWMPGPNPLTPGSQARHAGIFHADDGPKAHVAARRLHGWREWAP